MISLIEMKDGETGKVVKIQNGKKIVQRLEALGIRIGANVKKIGRQILGGPVIIEVERTQVAVGPKMAGKVFVE